jgi:hypothetical protein
MSLILGWSISQPGVHLLWFTSRKPNPSNIPKKFIEKIKMVGGVILCAKWCSFQREKILLPLNSYAYAHVLLWAKLKSCYIIYSS